MNNIQLIFNFIAQMRHFSQQNYNITTFCNKKTATPKGVTVIYNLI